MHNYFIFFNIFLWNYHIFIVLILFFACLSCIFLIIFHNYFVFSQLRFVNEQILLKKTLCKISQFMQDSFYLFFTNSHFFQFIIRLCHSTPELFLINIRILDLFNDLYDSVLFFLRKTNSCSTLRSLDQRSEKSHIPTDALLPHFSHT